MTDRGSSLWVATGSAVVGVLIGGAAVYYGRMHAPKPAPVVVAPLPEPTPEPEAELARADEPDPLLLAPSEGTLVDAVAKTRDSVVNLETEHGRGAGVIVDPHGIVLTNYHVIAEALAPAPPLGVGPHGNLKISFRPGDRNEGPPLVARFANHRAVKAEVIVADPEEDLAVLRLRPDRSDETFASARLGQSRGLAVGQDVFAVGNPFGLQHTVSRGIVSALDRTNVLDSNEQLSLIQLDASINLGNSGGPLFNLSGELVGIVTARRQQAVGIAFALPIDHVRGFLRAAGDPEAARSGMIGVLLALQEPLPAPVKELGYTAGLVVESVHDDKPAEVAGLAAGDTIVALRGKRLDGLPRADNPEALATHLQQVVRVMFSGERLPMTIVRGEELVELELEVGSASARDQLFIDAEDLLGLTLDRDAEVPTIAGVRESSPLRRYADALRNTTIARFTGRDIPDVDALAGPLSELRWLTRKEGAAPSVLIAFSDADGNVEEFLMEVR